MVNNNEEIYNKCHFFCGKKLFLSQFQHIWPAWEVHTWSANSSTSFYLTIFGLLEDCKCYTYLQEGKEGEIRELQAVQFHLDPLEGDGANKPRGHFWLYEEQDGSSQHGSMKGISHSANLITFHNQMNKLVDWGKNSGCCISILARLSTLCPIISS